MRTYDQRREELRKALEAFKNSKATALDIVELSMAVVRATKFDNGLTWHEFKDVAEEVFKEDRVENLSTGDPNVAPKD